MSQIDVNVIAPLGYSGPNLTGNNNFVQIVDVNGDTIFKSTNQASVSLKSYAIGFEAGDSQTGSLAIGTRALKNATSFNNTAVGNLALQSASSNCTAVGYGAGAGTTATSGTFVGYNAGTLASTGAYNTIVGAEAGSQVTTGQKNVFVGYRAGIGNSGGSITTGQNNVFIGTNGYDTTSGLSNTVILGDGSTTTLACSATTITFLSDARDKKEVADLPVGLEFVKELKPVTFTWDERDPNGKHGDKDSGFIAQDLKAVQEKYGLVEELKLVNEGISDDKIYASAGRLIPVLVKAIQELTAKVEVLESKNKK
jgi:hypothetical protein